MILKRIGLALAIVGIAAFGVGTAASAQTGDYPPGAPTASVSNPNPPAGGAVTVTVNNCTPGENVVVNLSPLAPITVACSAAGTAVASFSAPTTAGTYPGTVVLSSGTTLAFQIAVAAIPGGGLPATGSNSTQGGIWFGLGLLGLGAGLLAVAQIRRRQVRVA